jgi:hypothetical protein
MQIEAREEQLSKANESTAQSSEGDSKITDESALQSEKQERPSPSTEEGRQFDESDEHIENAESPTRDSIERVSNATVESDRHLAKQCLQSFVTERGT